MLNQLRSSAKSWAVKIFLGIVLACFILWEIPSMLQNKGDNTFLRSGQSVIKAQTYLLALHDTLIRNADAIGHHLTQSEIKKFSIPQRVFSRMYSDILLDEQVRLMKISASNVSTARLLERDPLLKTMDGQFDKGRFIDYVQKIHTTQADLFRYINNQAKRDQVIAASTNRLQAPDTFYSAVLLFQQETRAVNYLELTPSFIGKIPNPNKEILEHWFEKNNNHFRTPEYRQITYMHMFTEKLARPQDISEEAIKAFYEHNRERYHTPERRTIELLRFKNREEADSAAEKLAAGQAFEELVIGEKKTLKEIRHGPLKKSEIPILIASNVFGLEKGAISGVINDIQGPVIIRVIDIQRAMSLSLSTVRETIRNEIAYKVAANLLHENRKKIENARFEGATLKELASEYDLIAHEITIDANAQTPDGTKLADLPDPVIFLPAVFQSMAGVDADPLDLGNGYLWFHLERIIASSERTLDQVGDAASALWKEQQIQHLLDEKATEMKKALDHGMTIEEIANQYGLETNTERELRRDHISKKLGKTATTAVFSGACGTNHIASGADGKSRIIFKITDVTDPLDTKEAQSLSTYERNSISEHLRDDLTALLVSASEKIHPVWINNALYNHLLREAL
ncbi:MAG: peptidyl-prolyl cis-trans isomerase D [Candidatus Tokpelaia sp. JSC085]|nr:MAG: peptidyl-prolyl cis-trans isomerase D [Candidatus Tokpelaia sp. JSC085]